MFLLRRFAAMPIVAVLLFQTAHAQDAKDGGWHSAAAEVLRFEGQGDYSSAFHALDRYIDREGKPYPASFLGSAYDPRLYARNSRHGVSADRVALWNTISADAETYGRNDPIVGYDYAALGLAYTEIKDRQQAQAYYMQAVKILMAALTNRAPVWTSMSERAARLLMAKARYFQTAGLAANWRY